MASIDKKFVALQYTAAITSSITTLGLAATISWTSPALPYFASHSQFSKKEIYWITPLMNVGCILGFLINPLIIDNFGRKRTLLLYSIPQLTSWLLLVLADNHIIIIYLARILSGIGYGAGACALSVYQSEIGSRENRGIFMVFLKLSVSIGSFLTVLIGAHYSHKTMNIFLLMMPVTFLVTFIFMPDSSYFLEKNQEREKELELNNLSDINLDLVIENEKDSLKLNEAEKMLKSDLKTQGTKNEGNKLKRILIIPSNRKALLIIISCASQYAFSGYGITKSFTQNIFTYEKSLLSAKTADYLLAAISILSALISTFTIEKFKRRSLLISLGISATISLVIVALFFSFKNYNYNVTNFDWLPLFGIVIFDFSITNGCCNIYLAYQGELFTSDVKSVGIALSKVFMVFFVFLESLIYQLLSDIFDISVIFWIFATFCLFQTWVIYKVAPETKGKSLEEIQKLLEPKDRH